MAEHSSVVLVHGWAANGHVFDGLRPLLPANWRVDAPDLDGHGGTDLDADGFDIVRAADTLAKRLADGSDLLGWSLGGLVALHLAHRHPKKVRRLCLTAGFAKLQAAPDYPHGLAKPALDKMIPLFRQDYPKYMRQFLELQLLHNTNRADIISAILPDILKNGTPKALESALEALNRADARPLLPHIRQPVLLVYGNKDSITPPRMGEYLAQNLPNAELKIIDKAAHAPFLSHADNFASLLAGFFN